MPRIDSAALRIGSAISGLLMVLFLVLHLAGLVPALLAPKVFEAYAISLHTAPWLPLLEIGLTTIALLHLVMTLVKTMANQQAGNMAQLRSRRLAPIASLASRSKVAAGLITLAFLMVHLQQLRWPRPAEGAERAAVQAVLHQPASAALYGAAALAIGFHLLHGVEAAHRSLGWLTPMNSTTIRNGGRLLATVLAGGFLILSLTFSLGSA